MPGHFFPSSDKAANKPPMLFVDAAPLAKLPAPPKYRRLRTLLQDEETCLQPLRPISIIPRFVPLLQRLRKNGSPAGKVLIGKTGRICNESTALLLFVG